MTSTLTKIPIVAAIRYGRYGLAVQFPHCGRVHHHGTGGATSRWHGHRVADCLPLTRTTTGYFVLDCTPKPHDSYRERFMALFDDLDILHADMVAIDAEVDLEREAIVLLIRETLPAASNADVRDVFDYWCDRQRGRLTLLRSEYPVETKQARDLTPR